MTAHDIDQAQAQDNKDIKVEGPKGPTYFLDLEGVEYRWSKPTITTGQVRELAGWTTDQQVMLVNLATNEETVANDSSCGSLAVE